MNLIACHKCGLVYDRDHICFPATINDFGEYSDDRCEWDSRENEFVAFVKCTCGGRVYDTKTGGLE